MNPMTKIISPPTRPPRLSVPISPDVMAIFERLAKAGNMSTGKAVAEWLADTVEAAELMASTMERARAAPKLVTAELHAMMLGMADQTKELQDKYAKFKGPMTAVPDSGDGKRSAAARAGTAAASPPSCNTGGKLPEKGQSQKDLKRGSSSGKSPIQAFADKNGIVPRKPLPPAKVQAYADTNGIPPKAPK